MSRTVKISDFSLPASTLVILWALAISLIANFPVSDFVSRFTQPDSVSKAVSIDETFQDNSILPVTLPELARVNPDRVVFSSLLLPQAQAVFPLRHPPKVQSTFASAVNGCC